MLVPLQAVECAVNLLYNLGEGAAEELLHPNTGSIAQLVAGASALYLWHLCADCCMSNPATLHRPDGSVSGLCAAS